jgi:hypothetical protein
MKRRLVVAVVSVLTVASAITSVQVFGPGHTALAKGTKHKVGLFIDYSTIVERAVKITFSCTSTTGAYSLAVSNINVVDATGKSLISVGLTPSDALYLQLANGDQDLTIPMTQNSTTGLWQVKSTGFIYSGFCSSGTNVQLQDELTEGGDLNFGGPLS